MAQRIPTILTTLILLAAGYALADDLSPRDLVLSLGCKGCHVFEKSGGSLGPSLDNVGNRLDLSQIRQKLVDPKQTNPNSRMPSYAYLQEEQLQEIVRFLKNRSKSN